MIETDAAGKIMFARRAAFAVLFAVTMIGSLCLAALALSPGGLGVFDVAALVLFAITLPWMVAGFCNALFGFVIMRFSADPVAAVLPAVKRVRDDDPVTASTAILLCVRNELPVRTIRNLEPMLEGLCASGYGERFHLYLLSDTNNVELAIREEALFSELIATWRDRIAISYRRRAVNSGFKAGNIRDFCERWGIVTSSRSRSMPTALCHQTRSSGLSASCRLIPSSASCRG
jgi:membrane glycosyltransferase